MKLVETAGPMEKKNTVHVASVWPRQILFHIWLLMLGTACHVVPIFVPYMYRPPMFLLLLKMSVEVTKIQNFQKKYQKKQKKSQKANICQKGQKQVIG
jgi:hypothetical protein